MTYMLSHNFFSRENREANNVQTRNMLSEILSGGNLNSCHDNSDMRVHTSVLNVFTILSSVKPGGKSPRVCGILYY